MDTQQQNQVVSIRPAEQELAVPAFQPSVTSSPANVYLQTIDAQTHSERAISYVWRAPSQNLLLSPLAYGQFQILIEAPYKLNREDMIGPLLGCFDTQNVGAAITTDPSALSIARAPRTGFGYRPLLVLGEGNCVQSACESITIGVNGASWSELNGHLYSRSLENCFVPQSVQQRRYSTCGGAGSLAFDSKPLSGHVLGLSDMLTGVGRNAGGVHADICPLGMIATDNLVPLRAGYRAIEGATVDSHLSQRMSNFYDQVIKKTAPTAAVSKLTLQIRFPIQGAVFNSCWGCSGISRSDPRLRMALGIANYNSGQIQFTFKNLIKNIVRRLGRPSLVTNAAGTLANQGANITEANDIKVTYDTSYVPKLFLRYIRLPSFRSYPTSSAVTVYRRDVRRPVKQVTGTKIFDAGLFDGASNLTGLQCAGDMSSLPSTLTIRPPSQTEPLIKAASEAEVFFNGLQFPQIPNYLFLCFCKSSDVYNLQNPTYGVGTVNFPTAGVYTDKWGTLDVAGVPFSGHAETQAQLMGFVGHVGNADAQVKNTFAQEVAARYIAQNQASAAKICGLEITVQSASSSWTFQTGEQPYLEDRDQLWDRHVQNCCDSYMPAGRGKWSDRDCCALLSCSDFLLGIQSSPGVVMPIIVDVRVRFANRAGVSDGLCYTTGQHKGQAKFDDFMVGQPCCVALFNQQILSIASSSAVLSSQAFSQSTFASAVSQQG